MLAVVLRPHSSAAGWGAVVNTARTTYAIRVDGHLDDHWSAWLGGADLTRDDDGNTIVTVSVADQAQLHGVLAGLRDIGAVLTELRITDDPTRKFRQLESVNQPARAAPPPRRPPPPVLDRADDGGMAC